MSNLKKVHNLVGYIVHIVLSCNCLSKGAEQRELNAREWQTDSTTVDKYYFTWNKTRHSVFP